MYLQTVCCFKIRGLIVSTCSGIILWLNIPDVAFNLSKGALSKDTFASQRLSIKYSKYMYYRTNIRTGWKWGGQNILEAPLGMQKHSKNTYCRQSSSATQRLFHHLFKCQRELYNKHPHRMDSFIFFMEYNHVHVDFIFSCCQLFVMISRKNDDHGSGENNLALKWKRFWLTISP